MNKIPFHQPQWEACCIYINYRRFTTKLNADANGGTVNKIQIANKKFVHLNSF